MRGRALLLVVMLAGVTVSGCSEPRPPILRIDSIRYWFENDLLVLNVTVTNQADFEPDMPGLHLLVNEWVAKRNPGDGYGEDLEGAPSHSFLKHFTAPSNLYSSEEFPAKNRYYDDKAVHRFGMHYDGRGPDLRIQPGQTVTLEFGFLVGHYADFAGYYTVWLTTFANYPNNDSGDQILQSGCFNHNVPEFYGAPDGRPDCYYYSSDATPTDTGMSLFGKGQEDKAILLHDPPVGVPGAH